MSGIRSLKEWFGKFSPKVQQRLLLAVFGRLFFSGLLFFGTYHLPPPIQQKRTKLDFKGASQALDPEELWSEKMSRQVEDVSQKLSQASSENILLKKRLEELEKSVQILGTFPRRNIKMSFKTLPGTMTFPFTTFPSRGIERVLEESKFGRITRTASGSDKEGIPPSFKIVENTLPAGSHVRSILTSAVSASTATNASNDPRPITLRFVDDGKLPRGWKSSLKDAVLVGACYGDLSSERVLCCLTTISWVEANGEVVEKEIEGWVVGEDGRYGVRGQVIDRAGEVACSSLISGVLSGLSGFLQAQTTASIFPVSPFGQTNALRDTEMLADGARQWGWESARETF